MAIYTVLGQIEAHDLGPTSMHEHIFIDASMRYTLPRYEPPPSDDAVTMENLGFLRWNVRGLRDNLLLDDPELAVDELSRILPLGARSVVDLTSVGLGRQLSSLPAVSRQASVNILAACGYYVHGSHSPELEEMTESEVTEALVTELAGRASEVRPALIGELGTSEPVAACEWKVLGAAASAGVETGSSVNVHLDPRGRNATEILHLFSRRGFPPDRLIFSHMDTRPEVDYHREVADLGAVLSYDTFGSEVYFGDGVKDPSDRERIELLTLLIGRGHAAQLVLGCDVWTKTSLRRYGGMGYEHLWKRIVPTLGRDFGVTDEQIQTMVVGNPARLLDRPSMN